MEREPTVPEEALLDDRIDQATFGEREDELVDRLEEIASVPAGRHRFPVAVVRRRRGGWMWPPFGQLIAECGGHDLAAWMADVRGTWLR
ncbi:hypothetical protein ACWDA7_52590 [Streptomyces sp. NPDC001156]